MTACTALKSSPCHYGKTCRFLLLLTAVTGGLSPVASQAAEPPPAAQDRIRFNRDIRPILADNCFECHGPDQAKRQADLRLDQVESAYADRNGRHAIVPRDSKTSELVRRVLSDDPDSRMPAVDSGRTLTRRERDLLVRWIDQGGGYEPHWSFVAPRRPRLPAVSQAGWPENPIDHFILARLEQSGLRPSSRASRERLIRRVTLDLTGLPPTIAEVDAFLADTSPEAWPRVVDRLLASPRYGERMALEWLDAARYADTHGYLFDTERSMWRWRDQLIDSLNRNQPFDQFTIEQLAGDLLPNATLEQKIASGFNRNHIINNEAGATPAEYFVENILDRVNTTSTVWMGLTVACAQCHDHKYDPVSQREYYQLYAFFNNVPEVGLDGFNANAKPLITAPTPDQLARQTRLERQLKAAEEAFAPVKKQMREARRKWEKDFQQPVEPPKDGLAIHLPCDEELKNLAAPGRAAEFKDGMAAHEEGLFGKAVSLDGQRFVDLGDSGNFGEGDAFTLSAWVYSTNIAGRRSIFSRMEPPEVGFRGYTLQLIAGAPALFLVNQFPENLMQVQAKKAIEPHQWHHIAAVFDGSGKAAGVKLFVDGEVQKIGITIDKLNGGFDTEKPLLLGNGYPAAKFVGRLDEARVYDRALCEDEIAKIPGLSIHSHLVVEPDKRTSEQTQRIRNYYLEHAAPKQWREPYEQVVMLRESKKAATRNLPTVMVMGELEKLRETRMLARGAWNQPGETVTLGTPSFLPPMAEGLPKNRLGLARWLTDPRHPLTARVTVNRIWQMYFGTGLVRTSEDFGVQGEWPSHPELLDWLATEFIASGWNVKALHRLIVTSATYQQSSRVTGELLEADPENRLLARGPRHRLAAELIRDQALAVSGLLVDHLGGPSVRPYQPPGLWKEVAFDVTGKALTAQVYQPDKGEALYRRSMYTFWKRTSPPPTMLLFDAPVRDRCVVRRERTSTPLQALVLMNDPTYVEASRKLAERLIHEGGRTPRERIAFGFRLVTSRAPSSREVALLTGLLDEQFARLKEDAKAAEKLLSVGESPRDESLPSHELAAYTVIASVLLNLDETITKG